MEEQKRCGKCPGCLGWKSERAIGDAMVQGAREAGLGICTTYTFNEVVIVKTKDKILSAAIAKLCVDKVCVIYDDMPSTTLFAVSGHVPKATEDAEDGQAP